MRLSTSNFRNAKDFEQGTKNDLARDNLLAWE